MVKWAQATLPAAGPILNGTNNAIDTTPLAQNVQDYTFRVDENLGSNDFMWFRYSSADQDNTSSGSRPALLSLTNGPTENYGLSWVHQYAPNGAYVRSWGGLGTDPGKFNTPHGVLVDTRRNPPVLVVADRENGRLQIFDLDGKFIEAVTGILHRPCGAHLQGDDLVVPDLDGRVTILDNANKLITHLGENPNASLRANNGVDKPQWQDGLFLAPDERGGNLCGPGAE